MKYLMIDRRSFVGNDVLFWAKDHRGYTTDINKAHIFDEEEARKVDLGRSTDCAIPLPDIDEVKKEVVDFQHIDKKYLDRSYSYFTQNNSPKDYEKQISELQRKLNSIDRIFDEMTQAAFDYGLDSSVEELIQKGHEHYENILEEKK